MDIITMFAVVIRFIMNMVDLIKGLFASAKEDGESVLAQIN